MTIEIKLFGADYYLQGPRVPPTGVRPPPPPRFGGRLPPPGLPPRMPPPPMNPVFGPMRQRLPPPPRPGGVNRPSGPMPLFGPRVRAMAPMVPPMGLRGVGPRGPLMRPWHRRALPPQILSHMRPRFSIRNGNVKGKAMNNAKKVSKLEELELKKPWMTDEIRSEIQKKNKLYAKAKKNKDAKEWEEFKDLRNKVTRMIRDAKNDYLAKHPEQAHFYLNIEESYDQRNENYSKSKDESFYYKIGDIINFSSKNILSKHEKEHELYEDIEKWIMERKKRYPTKINVELRKAEEIEKLQRGEIIKQKQEITKRKRHKFLRSYNRKRIIKKEPIIISNNIEEQKETYRGLHRFFGTLCLRKEDLEIEKQSNNEIENNYKENINQISDEEEILDVLPKFTISNVPNLVANYESVSEESDMPEEVSFKKISLNNENKENNAIKDEVIYENRSIQTQPIDSVCKISKINLTLNQNSKNKEQKIINKMPPYTSQLLQKLLSRSIQHERNLICQCIKYIIDNNFFD
ncbi:putative uncharacterized protein DDB_G0274405 isoform X1 [Apis dorsata]|uniref:putative uncharacterized protein DDB_G0274405 isoform X1 n=1 Tax=Apis dorsata TaxID=7462 RepID=UPI0012939DC0|nr:putative uncharacterized protein DDB_G0274405 isoform X1 [Apis dorsata]